MQPNLFSTVRHLEAKPTNYTQLSTFTVSTDFIAERQMEI